MKYSVTTSDSRVHVVESSECPLTRAKRGGFEYGHLGWDRSKIPPKTIVMVGPKGQTVEYEDYSTGFNLPVWQAQGFRFLRKVRVI